MRARTIHASIVVIETSAFWVAYLLWDCNCTKLQTSARNYTFLHRITTCTALDQSESSNFFMYMITCVKQCITYNCMLWFVIALFGVYRKALNQSGCGNFSLFIVKKWTNSTTRASRFFFKFKLILWKKKSWLLSKIIILSHTRSSELAPKLWPVA